MGEGNPRKFFAERQGRGPKAGPVGFDKLRKLVISVFDSFRERHYFQEAFGYECVDGDADGTTGANPDAYFFRMVAREGIWPYWEHVQIGLNEFELRYESWDADALYDVVEVLHDLVSAPVDGSYHDFGNCGWHYHSFSRLDGQREFRAEINAVLRLGDPAYALNDRGQIVEIGPEAFRPLLEAPVPEGTEHDTVTAKIDAAVELFRARGASPTDRHRAVRDLADVLEALRPEVKEALLTSDEKALFNPANGFAIRHNNREQRRDYEKTTWLRWMFYVYLATIHAVLRLRKRT